ncbi:putative cytochrome c1 heme lyase [Rosellinia necatrix]|uniref:Holocytochrome c-type synthase n=1 Tax=Rosellinia necatrix TaxID=77044 RepID=A0A1W2TL69_ROSNE|nr:putative cytochrome c1 heme lyase [Rosellinia necatrix]
MPEDIIDQIFLNPNRHDKPPTTTATTTTTTMSVDARQRPAMTTTATTTTATCPVDHKSREAWLDKARAAAAASESTPAAPSLPPSHPPITTAGAGESAEGCPVDHGAREVWIQQARAAAAASSTNPASKPPSSSWSSYLPRIPFLSSSTPSSPSASASTPPKPSSLGVDREVSTIPRTATSLAAGDHAAIAATTATATRPANGERETGADGATGNWVYPSERMFFDAMRRKGHDPRAADMRAVVPIHNAVNERAWAEIKGWEAPYVQGSSCDGPRLHSFLGLSTHMSPRARFNTLLGYQAPFDRHDWVVDRCGKEIEYVIDFYAGRSAGGAAADGKLSFYLDVRPKLNSWEGIKMRALRAAGLA